MGWWKQGCGRELLGAGRGGGKGGGRGAERDWDTDGGM